MADPDKKKRGQPLDNYEDQAGESDSQTGGTGGQSGNIEFRYVDPLTGPKRDDLLSPAEIKRLSSIHKDLHKTRVDKQRILREEREARKEGRYVASMETQYHKGMGMGGGIASKLKSNHPLSRTAQFSGLTENKVNTVPSEKDMATNEDVQQKNEERYENKYRNMPKYSPPRPKPPGT